MPSYVEVETMKELLNALNKKYDQIIIEGNLCTDVWELAKKQLSNSGSEYAGIDTFQFLNTNSATLLLMIMDLIEGLFTKNEDKDKKTVEKKLRLYQVNKISEDEIFLNLRQTTY